MKPTPSRGPQVRPRRPAERLGPPAAGLERAAEMFRAVADPARLRLLDHVARREASVSELADLAGQGMSTVSQQLRVLYRAGLVRRRREGKHVYYRSADRHLVELIRGAIARACEASGNS